MKKTKSEIAKKAQKKSFWANINRLKQLDNLGHYLTDEQREYIKPYRYIDYPKARKRII